MALRNSSTNTTKYQAGGSGDNIIPDGFIKTVEKVWVDNFTFSASLTVGIGMIVDIAVIPEGKKITNIEVRGLDAASISATSSNSVAIGGRFESTGVTNGVQFLAATTLGTTSFNNVPLTANAQIGVELTGGTTTIFLHFLTASPSITAGTLRTKVSYT